MHSVCHPNPATVAVVDCMEKMTRAHCEFLRSERAHIKLNGYSLIRTDPYEGGDVVRPHTNPTNIHIDNAFLPRHDDATPREIYSRSIVYLNTVTEGGAPIVVWPRAHKAAAEVVQRLVSEQGEEAYHGVRWRDEVIAAMTRRSPTADPDVGFDAREVVWPGVGPATEVLMSEGDMIMFHPMSMHSASRCVNGTSRYCWVTSFHDDRVRALPHKLYQDKFDEAFLERLAPELQCIVDWLPPYMEEFGEQVLGPETQYWAYAARTTGVDAGGADGKRNRSMLSNKLRANQDAARQSLINQAARQRQAGAKL